MGGLTNARNATKKTLEKIVMHGLIIIVITTGLEDLAMITNI